MPVTIKRIYEPPAPSDGYRVLVERLWPRGMTRQAARLDGWAKELAPSPALRAAYRRGGMAWPDFVERYRAELAAPAIAAALADLRDRAKGEPVTLLYAKADPAQNSASVLAQVLRRKTG